MVISTHFLNYLESKIDYYESYDRKEEQIKYRKISKDIKPTTGAPLEFFLWYFKKGYNFFSEYWKDLDFLYQDANERHLSSENKWIFKIKLSVYENDDDIIETISLEEELKGLLETEFRNVCKIYKDRWNKSLNKKDFFENFNNDLKLISHAKEKSNLGSLSDEIIKEISLEWFEKFILRLKQNIDSLTHEYSKIAEFTFDNKEKLNKKDINQPRKEKDVFDIDSNKAKSLYNLQFKDEKNNSFIKRSGDVTDVQFQACLSNYNYTGPSFTFDCQTKYVAFILKWLQRKRIFENTGPAIQRMNCFYTNTNKLIRTGNLNFNKSKHNFEKILKRKSPPPKMETLPEKPVEEDILNYLCYQLTKIFLTGK